MRKPTHTLLLLAVLFITTAPRGTAQIIVTGEQQLSARLPAGSAVWMHTIDGRFFAALETGNIPAPYVILDENGHRGSYYWITGDPADALNDGCRVLWQGPEGVLLKTDDPDHRLFSTPPIDAMTLDGYTSPPVPRPLPKSTVLPTIRYGGDITAVLDSVRLDRLIRTEEHLSGETSFLINGVTGNLQTRYVYSPQIQVARQYLVNELADLGYTPYLQEFQLTSGEAVQIEPEWEMPGLACTGSSLLTTGGIDAEWHAVWQDKRRRKLTAVSRPAEHHAWAVGHRGLILAYDLKTSIARLYTGDDDRDNFDVYFIDSGHGWICGSGGLLLATDNGGGAWRTLNSGTDRDLYAVRFIDRSSGWAAGRDGTLLRTTDGGATWTRITAGTDAWLYDIYFTSPNEGWISGSGGTLLHTLDGGDTWELRPLPVDVTLLDIDFSPDGNGYIAGRGGTLLRSENGGRSWEVRTGAMAGDIYAVAAVDERRLVAGGMFGFIQSANRGEDFAPAATSVSFFNVIAEKTGTLHPDISYIICAHYDAINNHGDPMLRAPGADDNGSGCAAVMEAARVLAPYTSEYTIKFIFFTAEEIGLYGSKAYVGDAFARRESIAGVINLDMIGYESDEDGRVELHSNFVQTAMIDSIAIWADAWSLPLVPVKVLAKNNSDHAPFLNLGYQALMMIEDTRMGLFNIFYHSADDLLMNMNLNYFHANVKLAVGSLARFAGISLQSTGIPANDLQPGEFVLHPPWPNPFNPSVTAAIDLPREDGVTVEVFDLLGRRIRLLHQGRLTAGHHSFIWDGTDRQERPAASGVYLFVCRTGSGMTGKRKIVLMR